ncbi:tripartite tricarboxylate transporter TctB family protein [Radicibacter daui]|uniref:tripartite tricarboxylate transporter TctB family protein n=1 Tax=Radicibacter daui TaxID=3064829 RepID=UPI004046E0CD
MSKSAIEGPVPFGQRVPGIVLFVFAIIFGIGSWNIEYSFSSDPLGPTAFPLLLAGILAVLSLWQIAVPGPQVSWPQGRLLLKIVVLLALCFLTASTYPVLGFPVSTFILCVGVALMFEASLRNAVISGVGNAAFWYFIFTILLDIPLPLGSVFGG